MVRQNYKKRETNPPGREGKSGRLKGLRGSGQQGGRQRVEDSRQVVLRRSGTGRRAGQVGGGSGCKKSREDEAQLTGGKRGWRMGPVEKREPIDKPSARSRNKNETAKKASRPRAVRNRAADRQATAAEQVYSGNFRIQTIRK